MNAEAKRQSHGGLKASAIYALGSALFGALLMLGAITSSPEGWDLGIGAQEFLAVIGWCLGLVVVAFLSWRFSGTWPAWLKLSVAIVISLLVTMGVLALMLLFVLDNG